MEKFKNWVIVHIAEELKIITASIMLLTVGLMIYDYNVDTLLPSYFQFTEYDWWFWIITLSIISIANVYGLVYVDYYRCRILGDLVLQLSGFILLLFGWAFIANYPPLNIFMVLYPIWGIAMIIAGRHMGKRSRKRYSDFKKERE